MSDNETIRLRNLEDNRRDLASLGLLDPSSDYEESYEELDAYSDDKPVTQVSRKKQNFYGPVPGIEIGTVWATRRECCRDGVHRPTVAGIHGGECGAYSIALSGGYEDDVDMGDCFTYTGEGGRDLKGTKSNPKSLRTAPQSKDQSLTRGNLALSKNVETKNPVRVIRGYKLKSPFAPEEGYRYDGLYTVEKCWFTEGLSGFRVWKFAFRRCTNQDPSPWTFSVDSSPLTHSPQPSASCTHQMDKDADRMNDAISTVAEDGHDAAGQTGGSSSVT